MEGKRATQLFARVRLTRLGVVLHFLVETATDLGGQAMSTTYEINVVIGQRRRRPGRGVDRPPPGRA